MIFTQDNVRSSSILRTCLTSSDTWKGEVGAAVTVMCHRQTHFAYVKILGEKYKSGAERPYNYFDVKILRHPSKAIETAPIGVKLRAEHDAIDESL